MELSQQLAMICLLLVIVVIFYAAAHRLGWAQTRWTNIRESKPSIRRLERIVLTPQHQLHYLMIDGNSTLIATHPHGVQVIHPRKSSTSARAAKAGA